VEKFTLSDSIKKLGAGLIIVILIVMLAITFSSQSIDEITGIIAGKKTLGSYRGKEINSQVYFVIEQYCQGMYAQFGKVPDFILHSCMTEQLKQVYVIPEIGKELGLTVSKQSVENAVYEQIKQAYKQSQGRDEDDRLSIKEMYRREVAYNPIEVRVRMASISEVVNALGKDFPVPQTVVKSMQSSDNIVFDLNLVRFSSSELNKLVDPSITISEEEVKSTYEKEQSVLAEKDRKPFESQAEFVRNRLKNEKRQALIAEVKKKLSLFTKDYKLDEVSKAVGVKPVPIKEVKLTSITNIKLPENQTADLSGSDFLLSLTPGKDALVGPIQDGEFTVYAEVKNVKIITPKETANKKDNLLEELSMSISGFFLQEIMNSEAKRGKFTLNLQATSQQ